MSFASALVLAASVTTHVAAVGGKPESVIAYGDLIFASNLGAVQAPALDHDGYISKLDAGGNVLDAHFIPRADEPALNSPTGLAVVSDILYVADVNRVVGFDVRDGHQVFEAAAPATDIAFFNDLVYVGDNRLAVSATDVERLYTVNLRTRQWEQLAPERSFTHVNGLEFDEDASVLYVAENAVQTMQDGNGKLTAFNLSGTTLTPRWELRFGRFLDGVTTLGPDHLLVSDWNDLSAGGILHIVDTRTGSYVRGDLWGQRGLADLHYDRSRDRLILPAMLTGEIHLATDAFPAVSQLTCTLNGETLGDLTLGVDEFGVPRSAKFSEQACKLGHYSSDADYTWYEILDRACATGAASGLRGISVTRVNASRRLSVEVTIDREPDTNCPNPRACNPSTTGTLSGYCR